MKKCSKCKKDYSFNQFKPNPKLISGLDSWCNSCYKQRATNYYYNVYRAKLIQLRIEEQRKNYEAWSTKLADKELKRLYGIGANEKKSLWIEQGRCCPICSKPIKNWRKAHVDHNHKTGKVRGILCSSCNQGIGYLRDDFKLCQKAALYLKNDFMKVEKITVI